MILPPTLRRCEICGELREPKIAAIRQPGKNVYICGSHGEEEIRKALWGEYRMCDEIPENMKTLDIEVDLSPFLKGRPRCPCTYFPSSQGGEEK